ADGFQPEQVAPNLRQGGFQFVARRDELPRAKRARTHAADRRGGRRQRPQLRKLAERSLGPGGHRQQQGLQFRKQPPDRRDGESVALIVQRQRQFVPRYRHQRERIHRSGRGMHFADLEAGVLAAVLADRIVLEYDQALEQPAAGRDRAQGLDSRQRQLLIRTKL